MPASPSRTAPGWLSCLVASTLALVTAACGGKKDNGVTYPVTCSAPTVVIGAGTFPATAPSGCQKPIVASALGSTQVQHLGIHKVGENVSFNVPDKTGSITVVSQASSGVVGTITLFVHGVDAGSLDNAVIPTALTAPNGTVYYDDVTFPSSRDKTTWHAVDEAPTFSTSALVLPNTTQGINDSENGYPSGTWKMVVNDYAYECASGQVNDASSGLTCSGGSNAAEYDVSVLTKNMTPPTGTVDVSIYLATLSLTAPTAATSATFARYLTTLNSLYANVGVCLGKVTLYDLPAWAKAKYATGVDADKSGPCENQGQMFTLSQPGNTLNFFFVDDIAQGNSAPSGGTIVGIDGAIPAPSSFGGTVYTGAVINASDLNAGHCVAGIDYKNCGADRVAYLSAHEGGHWMGLYHTTEAVGFQWDTLSDTPQCNCSSACLSASAVAQCCNPKTMEYCDGSGTTLSVDDCSKATPDCGGGDNLMFWLLDLGSKGNLSTEQGKVIRSNVVVH